MLKIKGGVYLIFIFGNEPYSIDKEKEKILKSHQNDVKIVKELKSEYLSYLHTVSLFGNANNKMLLYVVEDAKELKQIPKDFIIEKNLIILFYGHSKDFSFLLKNKNVESICHNKVTKVQLKKLIQNYVCMNDNVATYFIDKIGYFKYETVNLYTVLSELQKIKVFEKIDKELIDKMFYGESVEDNAFSLGKLLSSGQKEKALKVIQNCPSKDVLLYIGAMQRYFRVGWKKNFFEANEVGFGDVVEPKLATKALEFLAIANEEILNGSQKPKNALLKAGLKILAEGSVNDK